MSAVKSISAMAAVLLFITVPAWPVWLMVTVGLLLWILVATGLNVRDLRRTPPGE